MYSVYTRQADYRYHPDFHNEDAHVVCDWQELRSQLLFQWPRITPKEIDYAGPDRHRIALLVEHKYGIHSQMVENYLCNFERTMPMAA